MSGRAPRFEPPAGFEALRGPGGQLLVARSELLPELERVGFGPVESGGLLASDRSGRRAMRELELGGERWIVRRFERGGLVRHVRQGHSDPLRPFRELALAEQLRAAGVATPRVGLARAQPRRGGGWDLELATACLEDTEDAWEALVRLGAERGGRRELLARIGAALERAFAAGLHHVDLNPRNLLIGAPGALDAARAEERAVGAVRAPEGVWVIDLDRCRMEDSIDAAARARMLARTWRWVRRREEELERPLEALELARLVRACGGDDWRATWGRARAVARRERGWRRWTRGLDDLLARRTGRRRQARP